MVCISCLVIPALLYVWHSWIRPFVMPIIDKYFRTTPTPAVTKSEDNTSQSAQDSSTAGLKCPFSTSKVSNVCCFSYLIFLWIMISLIKVNQTIVDMIGLMQSTFSLFLLAFISTVGLSFIHTVGEGSYLKYYA